MNNTIIKGLELLKKVIKANKKSPHSYGNLIKIEDGKIIYTNGFYIVILEHENIEGEKTIKADDLSDSTCHYPQWKKVIGDNYEKINDDNFYFCLNIAASLSKKIKHENPPFIYLDNISYISKEKINKKSKGIFNCYLLKEISSVLDLNNTGAHVTEKKDLLKLVSENKDFLITVVLCSIYEK